MPQDQSKPLTLTEIYKRKLRDDALSGNLPQHVTNAKSQELLRMILGTPGQKWEPELRSAFDLFTNPSNEPRTSTPDQYRFGPFRDEASPSISSAYASAIRDYPASGRRVTGIHDIEEGSDESISDDDDDVLGNYNPYSGGIGIRKFYKGKPIDTRKLRETILHELSHAYAGTEDLVGSYGPDKPISSYNVSALSGNLGADINLPLSGSPEAQQRMINNGELQYILKKQKYATKKR